MGKGKNYNRKLLYDCILEKSPVNRLQWTQVSKVYPSKINNLNIVLVELIIIRSCLA